MNDVPFVRYLKISAVTILVSMLAAAHVMGGLPLSSQNTPQATEAKAQETVDLKISGMT
jgi:hypothetical protein